jgi:hypothetical protein
MEIYEEFKLLENIEQLNKWFANIPHRKKQVFVKHVQHLFNIDCNDLRKSDELLKSVHTLFSEQKIAICLYDEEDGEIECTLKQGNKKLAKALFQPDYENKTTLMLMEYEAYEKAKGFARALFCRLMLWCKNKNYTHIKLYSQSNYDQKKLRNYYRKVGFVSKNIDNPSLMVGEINTLIQNCDKVNPSTYKYIRLDIKNTKELET